MKKIELRPLGIAAILLLCAVFCQGQTFSGEVMPKKDTTIWNDTIPITLLVCDTAINDGKVFWIKAFSKRKGEYELVDVSVNPNTSTYIGGGVYSTTLLGWSPVWENKAVYTHLEYLDSRKKPLSKNIIVWQSVSK